MPLPPPPSIPLSDPGLPFEAMAARIRHNTRSDFGGALLVVSSDGMVLSELTLSPSPNVTEFWTVAKSKVEAACADALGREQARAQGIYGGIR